MAEVRIERVPNQSEYDMFLKIYENNEHVSIDVDHFKTKEEITALASFLLEQEPTDFCFSVLANLVERENFPESLLSNVFVLNDTGCQVSICLRDSLPDNIKKLCIESDKHEISSHFNAK